MYVYCDTVPKDRRNYAHEFSGEPLAKLVVLNKLKISASHHPSSDEMILDPCSDSEFGFESF
jgi:hypothetical protein